MGSFGELRQEFSRLGVHRNIGMRLRALHAAIHGVRDACHGAAGRAPASNSPTAASSSAAVVTDALLALISCGGSAEPLDAMNWRGLRRLLADTMARRSLPHGSPESVVPFAPRHCQRSLTAESLQSSESC